MNATEHWVEAFKKHMNCVTCRSATKPLTLYFHSGVPVDVKNTPIEDIEARLDYIDTWCDDCRVYRSTRARAVNRLKTKKEAAVMAGLNKAKWYEAPAHFYVVQKDLVVNKQRFLDEAKQVPCANCGVRYPSVAMDFHHLLPKGGNVGAMTRDGTGIQELIREMERCTVMCANCHRIVTHLGYYSCFPLWRYEDHKERLLAKMKEYQEKYGKSVNI